jgi:peptidoglycan/LPS O-acetylase OafA/YrhL
MQSRVGPREERIPALDGLRGVAVLLVLFFHFTMFGRLAFVAQGTTGLERGIGWTIAVTAMSGWIGVDLFFVLSGYLITTILLRERGGPRFFRSFYLRRAARILPLYYAFLGCYAAYVVAVDSPARLTTLGWPLAFATNIALGLHGDGAIPHEIQHLWSIAIEEQFYLVFPVFVLLLSRTALRVMCASGILTALVFRMALRPDLPTCGFLTPARCDGLLVGALVAALMTPGGIHEGLPSSVRAARWALGGTFAALASFVVWRGSLMGADVIVDVYGRTPLNLFFGAVVAACVLLPGSPLVRALSVAPLRFFGRYSYGMYVLHMPVIAGLLAHHATVRRFSLATGSVLAGYALFLTIATSATLVAALASFFALERPFLRMRERAGEPAVPAAEQGP